MLIRTKAQFQLRKDFLRNICAGLLASAGWCVIVLGMIYAVAELVSR